LIWAYFSDRRPFWKTGFWEIAFFGGLQGTFLEILDF